MSEWKAGLTNERTNKRTNERTKERTKERTNARTNERMNKRRNARTQEQMNERTNERTNEQMSERIKDRTWMKNLVIEGRKDWGSEKINTWTEKWRNINWANKWKNTKNWLTNQGINGKTNKNECMCRRTDRRLDKSRREIQQRNEHTNE